MLLDSNIIIYAARPEHGALREFLGEKPIAVSAITRVEVLGYHRLTEPERELLIDVFDSLPVLPVTDDVIEEAIRLRQVQRMSLGDALIAATAIVNHLPLATHNTTDYAWITRLQVIDPIAS